MTNLQFHILIQEEKIYPNLIEYGGNPEVGTIDIKDIDTIQIKRLKNESFNDYEKRAFAEYNYEKEMMGRANDSYLFELRLFDVKHEDYLDFVITNIGYCKESKCNCCDDNSYNFNNRAYWDIR